MPKYNWRQHRTVTESERMLRRFRESFVQRGEDSRLQSYVMSDIHASHDLMTSVAALDTGRSSLRVEAQDITIANDLGETNVASAIEELQRRNQEQDSRIAELTGTIMRMHSEMEEQRARAAHAMMMPQIEEDQRLYERMFPESVLPTPDTRQ